MTEPAARPETKHRIYLIEDHPIMRETLTSYITMQPDMTVCGVSATGEEALERVVAARTDLVVVDLSLPMMSGIDFVQQVKALAPSLPCVMLSGHDERSYARRALEAGAAAYVIKGNPRELPVAIRQALSP